MHRSLDLARRVILSLALVTLWAGVCRADVLYAISGLQAPWLFKIDPLTGGALTSSSFPTGVALRGLCADGPELLSIEGLDDNISDRLFRITPGSGSGATVGNTQFNWNVRGCDVHRATNTIYVVTDTPGPTPRLFRVSRSTGAATLVATSPFVPGLDRVTAMAISPAGVAYVTDVVNTTLFRMDLGTGALTFIGECGPVGTSSGFNDLAFDSEGRLWGVRSLGGLYRIDTDTAVATLAAPSPAWAGIAFIADAVVATERTTWARLKGLYH